MAPKGVGFEVYSSGGDPGGRVWQRSSDGGGQGSGWFGGDIRRGWRGGEQAASSFPEFSPAGVEMESVVVFSGRRGWSTRD
eukprot:CAMPEP_0113300070 /NCGR_PEP_ID=MMETSP0010_2-20120614/1851_1 /TAXON_ID=216773 ORGANISM="Corethron hystrix, Strain 308" /NCGR_SAMPLE_ID=MMETSP0010_2 /ASSEMBLY_ACC=CAM_ASM_000155 /LENGTH=80 /DNA_ID=CAMNT_0000153429 /DNA_START=718 /DNA_END=957 /DNA_ORIENTATION=+ /assembly_acc=CAM_ASM_000155